MTYHPSGFSADVTCEFNNLTNETTPSLDFRSDIVKDWNKLNFTGRTPVMYSEISSDCPPVKFHRRTFLPFLGSC
jgi:hypothetical protein